MLTKRFGKLGWPVSAVGLGAWNIGNQWGDIDDVTAWSTVRAAYDAGMTLFDVAESYGIPNGLSEMRVGRALTGIRHNVILVSKIGNWAQRTGGEIPKNSVDSIRISGHAILGRLRTDWVDVILCHKGNLEDPTVYLEGFEALKEEGCLRVYGISTNDLDVLKRFNREGTCSVVQVDYSLLNREPEKAFLPYCEEHGIAVMVRGPLAKGLLSGRYTKGAVFTDTFGQAGTRAVRSRTSSRRVRCRSDGLARSSHLVKRWYRLRFAIRSVTRPYRCRFPGQSRLSRRVRMPTQAAERSQRKRRTVCGRRLTGSLNGGR